MYNSFRYCNISPEVMRLKVMIYVRFLCDRPRISRSRGVSTFARVGSVLAELVRADVRGGYQEATRLSSIVSAVGFASKRGVRQDQR